MADAVRIQADPGQCAFFLDFDGTLVEIVEHPEDVQVSNDLRSLIDELTTAAEGALAVVTGRSIHRLDRFLEPLQLPAAGVHGCQFRRRPRGEIDESDSAGMDALRPALNRFISEHPQVWMEDKGASLALHYRRAPELEADINEMARSLAADSADVVVQRGKSVVELRPAGADKASAVARFMDSAPFAGRKPVFIGDDVTDEAAFAWVNAHDGISVRVGPLEGSQARHAVADVTAALSWLRAQISRGAPA